ncbi:MAG: RecX family transcriptional regulator [Gemmatimonadaceae bacterium]|nr:RecX family transcriptional regulator [Gemmatimonadaceae bacterium]
MRIADAGARGGMESERRGARYPATDDAVPSSRARAGERGAAARAQRRQGAAEVVLQPPVRVMGVAEDPRVKGRVRVRCQGAGGTVTLVIGASGVRAFNVRTGMVLDSVGWAALSREARVVHAQDAALRMLSTTRRSRRDLELRLRRREQDPTVIGDALGRLDALGLLNEDEFALAEAAAQLRNASRSSGAVKRRLRQRGVSADVVEAAVASVVESEGIDDAARCDEAATKRVRQLRGLDRQAAQRRLGGFLLRRGFSPDLVFAACRRALAGWGGAGAADTEADGEADGADEHT